MERGPLALFGAIVAVGLGPALWLGVQVGNVEIVDKRPPVVSEHEPSGTELLGGKGAADDTGSRVIRTTPEGKLLPITKSPTASPSAKPSGTSVPSPSGSAGPTSSAVPSASSSADGSPSAPAGGGTEASTVPSQSPAGDDPSTGGSGDPSTPSNVIGADGIIGS